MNTLFKLQPLTVALALASISSITYADTENLDTTTNTATLAPIVVTAHQHYDSHGLMVIADPKQPIQPVPASDGAAYLQSIMGFNSIQNGGTNGDVTFRGMFGSRIKMLTNGTEKLGACPSRMDSPTSYIAPESFDKITVIKGPQTVQYATPGSAATVMFEREAPRFDDQPYQGDISVMLGSFGRLDHNIDTSVGNNTVYARLNANRSVSDDYKDGNGDTVHSNWERWNSDLAVGWTPDDDTWLELSAGTGDGEAAYAGRSMDGSQFKRQSLGLHAEKQNINTVITKLEGQIDYSYNDHIMDNYSLRTAPTTTMTMMGTTVTVPNEMSMEVTRRTINSRVAMTSEWDNLSLITGIDSQYHKHGGDMQSSAMPSMNTPYREDLKFQTYGAFGELSYTANDNNTIVTGIRADHVKIDNIQNDQQRKNTVPSGFIRIESDLTEYGIKSYAGIGYVERTPDYWELYSTSTDHGVGTTDMMGMTTYRMTNNLNNLDNEKTAQLDIGFEQHHGAFKSWLSAYAGLVNDFILIRYDDTNSRYPLANNVDATIAGAEFGVGYDFSDQIQADISAMYAWGENTTDNTPLPQIAPLEGRFNLRYVADQYSLGLLWRAVASQNRIALNEGNIVGYDMSKSKAFNTIALNASYQFNPDIILSLGIDNLLDKDYREHLNKAGAAGFGYAANEQFNNPGRNYWARFGIKF